MDTITLGLTVRPSYCLRVDLSLARTQADLGLPDSRFVTTLVTLRSKYSFSTNRFVDALVQYNTDRDQLDANLRFNPIHHPLSDFFVVYNEQRFTTDARVEPGRGFVVKLTRMMGFWQEARASSLPITARRSSRAAACPACRPGSPRPCGRPSTA